MADRTYDGEPVYQAVVGHEPDPLPDIIIPSRASAVPSTADTKAQSERDRHMLPRRSTA